MFTNATTTEIWHVASSTELYNNSTFVGETQYAIIIIITTTTAISPERATQHPTHSLSLCNAQKEEQKNETYLLPSEHTY